MRWFWGAGLGLALLTGCSVSPIQRVLTGPLVQLTSRDAVSAQAVLTQSINAKLLPPTDPWLMCMQTISALIAAAQAGPGYEVPVNGVLTEAARLHVLDTMLASASTTPGQQSCAQILLGIQLRAAAGLTPGGALLPIR